jgi:serine/threonine-protein kinase HipA
MGRTSPGFSTRTDQIKDIKLAMRVGKSRHYNVSSIQGRHFVLTGLAAGFSREKVASIFTDIHTRAEQAFATALAGLPAGFPETLFASVNQGFEQGILRLQAAAD